MISLVGGELYQWDTGRIVRVVPDENVKVHEVHFSTKRMDYAYVLKTYIVDGVTYCAIPNIILQQSNRLLCYEVCENSDGEETIANTYFDIIKRNRPEDYVYTEQDHFTIQALSNRVDKLEESSHTHINKTELDTITKEDLETWRSPNSSAITGGAQVGTLFEDLEVTTTLAEDASEWTSASSQPFKCTFRPSPGQMVVVKVKDLDVDTITTAKIPPTGYPLGQTIIGNYSVVNSRLQSWYNDADSVPPTPNDAQANSCLVFEDQYYDSEHLTPSLPTCILYTKTPGTYKVTVTTLKHSIGPESVVKMYDVRPSTFAEYGTYTNWKDLTKSGKYDLWEVSIKKTNYYNGVYLKEVNGTKYIYVYRSEQKKDPESGIFTTTDYTLTYDTATETVTCSDTTINPETDVIISVHLDQVISTVPDNATSLGKPSADKVGKMLTTVDLGEGVIDNKWQSRRYEYQWVDAPKGGSADVVKYTEQTLTDDQKAQARTNIGAVSSSDLVQSDWNQNDTTAKDYIKNRICYEKTSQQDIAGLKIYKVNYKGEANPDLPFQLGQIWNANYGTSSMNNLEVKQSDDGMLYIGTLDLNDIPFYIGTTSSGYNSSWASAMQPSATMVLTGVSGTYSTNEIVQIPSKFIPRDSLVINAYDYNGTSYQHLDKTYEDITNALADNRMVFIKAGDLIFRLNRIYTDNNAYVFNSILNLTGDINDHDNITINSIIVYNDNTNKRYSSTLLDIYQNITTVTNGDIKLYANPNTGQKEYLALSSVSDPNSTSKIYPESYTINFSSKKASTQPKVVFSGTRDNDLSGMSVDVGLITASGGYDAYTSNLKIFNTFGSIELSAKSPDGNPYAIRVNSKIRMSEEVSVPEPISNSNPATKKYVDDSIKAIPVDGTTIKFNEYGQLTLALSNANGVSF